MQAEEFLSQLSPFPWEIVLINDVTGLSEITADTFAEAFSYIERLDLRVDKILCSNRNWFSQILQRTDFMTPATYKENSYAKIFDVEVFIEKEIEQNDLLLITELEFAKAVVMKNNNFIIQKIIEKNTITKFQFMNGYV